MKTKSIFAAALWLWAPVLLLQALNATPDRTNLDADWRFALGHSTDKNRDFNHAKSYFSYLAKTGFGDGPASVAFDDRTWRKINLPHDWAVEMPFSSEGSHSHGYKAVGPGFPENSVGWYRKQIDIVEADLGKKIFIEFDGIFRDADVFVNGFFIGNEPSGYLGQNYEITDYLNYGARNTIVVRVDASMEEGWFYEGAGIYRHVWLTKSDPLHFVKYGVWVNPQKKDVDSWVVNLQAEVVNQGREAAQFQIDYRLNDAEGKEVVQKKSSFHTIQPGETITDITELFTEKPHLWSVDTPHLYHLNASVVVESREVAADTFDTPFGFRTLKWDADRGFFLNGKALKLVGTNNHQDHAGVGAAFPDSLQDWRLKQLKSMGNNCYRASHNPATPELLQACDRLGMLVIDETRLMGINEYHLSQLTRMVRRDRNHPSVILWSLGNEEWAIEGNIKGARITQTMQDYCHRLDPTRYTTVAISGGWGGISHTVQVAGINYIGQAHPEQQHADYPEQILLGTEETTTHQTRGIYVRDDANCYLPPLENGNSKGNCEIGWKYYAEREWGAGVIFWTGFDYRGEPTPFAYPAIASQFGILDTCGFPKDSYYYLKSWWTQEPVLHLFPHWNWEGREGETIEVRLHSNCATAELFLNGQSLGKQTMERNGHLAWPVVYQPGELRVEGKWTDGSTRTATVQTTGKPDHIELTADRNQLLPDRNEVAMVTVKVVDKDGRLVPTAADMIHFELEGVGTILGVGNGNPSSHEPDVFVEKVWGTTIGEWNPPNPADSTTPLVFEASFDAPEVAASTQIELLFNTIGENQKITLNGEMVNMSPSGSEMVLKPDLLKAQGNSLKIEATPFPVWRDREGIFEIHPALFKLKQPASEWKRKTFNGLAQIIVGANPESGNIELKASGEGLESARLTLVVQ